MEVLGVKDLSDQFKKIADHVNRSGLRSAGRAGASVILEEAKRNIRETFVNRTGALENSGRVQLTRLSRTELVSYVLFDIVYAAVHEYGLLNQVITDRQRRFFWAMWYETGHVMWKALALSKTYTIPARPYLRPAIDAKQIAAVKEMARVLAQEIKIAVRRSRPAATVLGDWIAEAAVDIQAGIEAFLSQVRVWWGEIKGKLNY